MINKYLVKVGVAGLFVAAFGFVEAQKQTELAEGDLWLQPGKAGYTVEFVSDADIAGLQFDVKGIEVAEGQFDCGIGLASTHIASCSINSEGNLRVIVFSMDNAPIPDGTMVFIRNAATASRSSALVAARDAATPVLDGVLFADAEAANVTPDHLK